MQRQARVSSAADDARLFLAARHVAAALGVCAVLALVGAVWPPIETARVGFWYAASGVLAVVATGTYLLREHRRTAVVAVVLGVLVCGLLVAACRTAAGVVTTALGMIGAGQAAVLIGDRRVVRRVFLLALVVLGVAMAVSSVPFDMTTWLVIAATTGVSSLLVADLGDRLRALATTDDLTGALTRSAFEEQTAALLHRTRRAGGALTVVCVDVDGFKAINDTRGHLAGDDVLRALVGSWRGALGSADAIGRIGGDEFAIALVGGGSAGAQHWVDKALLLAPSDAPSWSHGVAVAGPQDTVRDLLGRADDAMYVRKGRRAPRPVADRGVSR
ncbi:MAG TPA: GGDEF domain-containing protein [Cellulomonas sp.]